MTFHGKCEQSSTDLTQGTSDRPNKDSITVPFGQPVSFLGAIYRTVGEGLLTWVQVRGSLQEHWLTITHWSLGEGSLTRAWVRGYLHSHSQGAWVAQRELHHQNAHCRMGEDEWHLYLCTSVPGLQSFYPVGQSLLHSNCYWFYDHREEHSKSCNFQEPPEPSKFDLPPGSYQASVWDGLFQFGGNANQDLNFPFIKSLTPGVPYLCPPASTSKDALVEC